MKEKLFGFKIDIFGRTSVIIFRKNKLVNEINFYEKRCFKNCDENINQKRFFSKIRI